MNSNLSGLLFAAIFACVAPQAGCAADATAPGGMIVLLKLDDLVRHGSNSHATVSPRWQHATEFLEGEKIHASFGILCDSLEGDCPAYCDWLKQRIANGVIEIWDHGYFSKGLPAAMKAGTRTAENEGGSVEDQAAMFEKSLTLVKEKIGIDMVAFGPHSTHLDGTTYEALAKFPQMKAVWFYAPPKGVKTEKIVIQRLMELEKPLFVPNPEQLKENFEKKRATLPYVAVQGHPNQWEDARFEGFKKAVLYLRDQGCRFMTISEYIATTQTK
jgi:hypothetical protein